MADWSYLRDVDPLSLRGKIVKNLSPVKSAKNKCEYASTHNANKKRHRGDGTWVFDWLCSGENAPSSLRGNNFQKNYSNKKCQISVNDIHWICHPQCKKRKHTQGIRCLRLWLIMFGGKYSLESQGQHFFQNLTFLRSKFTQTKRPLLTSFSVSLKHSSPWLMILLCTLCGGFLGS